MHPLSIEELAQQADVEPEYVRRLIGLGALEQREGPAPYGGTDLRRVRLLRAWEEAGLSVESVMRVVREGTLSLSWLDTPVMTRAEQLDLTYEQLCREEEVPLSLVQAVQEALGLAPPEPADRVREGDRELVQLVRAFISVGAGQEPTLRLLRVYADSLRRIAKAEAELYETRIEHRLRGSGMNEADLLEYSARFGEQVVASLQRALIDVYQRHREHVWIEHSITHAEIALESAGLYQKVPRPPAICFVDLTGYTRLTEEQGDVVAARLASSLASLVEDISRRHGGTPIRWLGDGGMFHFKDPGAAVLSGLDMVESAPRAGLPPMHIGIHTGPVIFQDGDVYGRTVNLASRIASHAGAGQVLASSETMNRSGDTGVRFEPVGSVPLKGIGEPVSLYQAFRSSRMGNAAGSRR
jgi:class 3 adenylate cyclase